MKNLAFKFGWWCADALLGLAYVLFIAWPLNFLMVYFLVWWGIPASAGQTQP